MSAYTIKKNNTLTKPLTHSVKRLYRRTNKIDAVEFELKKQCKRYKSRHIHSEQELDEWLIQTFASLYKKKRCDQDKFVTEASMIHEALRLGTSIKKMYFALESLLNQACISETQITSKDIWLFAFYQTLRNLERAFYQEQHIYTSVIGTRNSKMIIARLNQLIPGWIDYAGKISKTL